MRVNYKTNSSGRCMAGHNSGVHSRLGPYRLRDSSPERTEFCKIGLNKNPPGAHIYFTFSSKDGTIFL